MEKENKIELTTIELEESIFNKIFEYYKGAFEVNYEIFHKITNKINRRKIYFDGNKTVLIAGLYINYILYKENINPDKFISTRDEWKTYRVVRKNRQSMIDNDLDYSVNGLTAYITMMSILKKFYSKEELEDIFASHEADYNDKYKQYHYIMPSDLNEVVELKNCFKYDINSAYASALIEIFPKAKAAIEEIYAERKIKPENKKLLNYFVGFLCCRNHRKTYNYIVQRTTKKLYNAIAQSKGHIVYANTDGFIIQSPKNRLETSKNIGDFKLEYEGIVYFIQTKNYWLYQCGDNITSNLSLELRDNVDLSKNKYVVYDREFVKTGTNEHGFNTGYFKATNIKEVVYNG